MVKILTIGFGLLFLSLYGIASLLAKLVEKDMAKGEPTGTETATKRDAPARAP